jgi:hypothetical protein
MFGRSWPVVLGICIGSGGWGDASGWSPRDRSVSPHPIRSSRNAKPPRSTLTPTTTTVIIQPPTCHPGPYSPLNTPKTSANRMMTPITGPQPSPLQQPCCAVLRLRLALRHYDRGPFPVSQ